MRVCKNCGKEFNGVGTQKFCKECMFVDLECDYCHKHKIIKRSIYKENGLYHTCSSSCSVKMQHKYRKENDPNYYESQRNATNKANEKMKSEGKGVWSKEQHIKAEKTKKDKGVDLGNQEFRKKIGCNGNSNEIQEKLKREKLGIYSSEAREKSIKWHREEWGDIIKQKFIDDPEYLRKTLENLLHGSVNPSWLSLSLDEKISQSESWLADPQNKYSSARPYIKNNLELLKLRKENKYDFTFSDCEDIIKNSPSDGYIYAHVDSRDNTIFYIGQTIRDPIQRYAEHYSLRKELLNGYKLKDYGFDSFEDFTTKTGLTKERFENTKIIILQQLNKSDCKDEDDFINTLNFLEQEAIKNYCPQYNFYMIDNKELIESV